MSDAESGNRVSHLDFKPDQIQYQALNAMLAIGKSYESEADAPEGVNDAVRNIQAIMGLVGGERLSDAEEAALTMDGYMGRIEDAVLVLRGEADELDAAVAGEIDPTHLLDVGGSLRAEAEGLEEVLGYDV